MCGFLAAGGIRVSETRVGKSLCRVTSAYLNPNPYHAEYFGHKLHIDQNEKLVMYGVVHN